MKRPFFKFALATLTFCWLAGIAKSAARAQSEGPFGTLVPIPQGATPPWAPGLGGGVATFGTPPPLQSGRFSPASNRMFGTPVIPLENTPWQAENGILSGPLGELQPGGVYEAYGTPGAYGPYNGNRPATGYYGAGLESSSDNSGGGYLNNDGGYRGYSPYYGNNGGYGVNYGAVISGSYGNYSAPEYYGSGYYTKGISGNGYSP
jgi:hypothetical protein